MTTFAEVVAIAREVLSQNEPPYKLEVAEIAGGQAGLFLCGRLILSRPFMTEEEIIREGERVIVWLKAAIGLKSEPPYRGVKAVDLDIIPAARAHGMLQRLKGMLFYELQGNYIEICETEDDPGRVSIICDMPIRYSRQYHECLAFDLIIGICMNCTMPGEGAAAPAPAVRMEAL